MPEKKEDSQLYILTVLSLGSNRVQVSFWGPGLSQHPEGHFVRWRCMVSTRRGRGTGYFECLSRTHAGPKSGDESHKNPRSYHQRIFSGSTDLLNSWSMHQGIGRASLAIKGIYRVGMCPSVKNHSLGGYFGRLIEGHAQGRGGF